MSVEVKWTDKGATISSLNAVKEYPALTNDDVDAAIADGRLDTRQGSFMGKSYTKLLRHQVKKLARDVEKKQKEGSNDSSDDEEDDEVAKREPKWSDKGATISDKNAIKEFPVLTMESIESALESEELESRTGNFMGKTYRKLLLHQVRSLAEKLAEEQGSAIVVTDEDDDDDDDDKEEGEEDDDDDDDKTKKGATTSMSGGERKKRIAEIDEHLVTLEGKRRKLLEEKKTLGKSGE